MKTILLFLFFAVCFSVSLPAQTGTLAPDQNPNYQVSQAKYMQIADSLNRWHATTVQNTYAAPDWYERKMENRQQRQAFRRELRLTRARNNSYYYTPSDYQGSWYGYNNGWNNNWRSADRWLSPIYDITLPLLLYHWWR